MPLPFTSSAATGAIWRRATTCHPLEDQSNGRRTLPSSLWHPYPTADGSSSHHHLEQDNSIEYDRNVKEAGLELQGQRRIAQQPQPVLRTQHEIDIIRSEELSFDKRESV
ncbi:hypothetical protein EZV62_002454 [Acer yangbiense]|uniref:Uncharacterized protein n=1 Tax=Acer yangbiense TaxID=1000413 RepID=A0A5C7IXB1_9ROSI|nr:hypothetical protein EZV62_002454 [Acer yangbiense]